MSSNQNHSTKNKFKKENISERLYNYVHNEHVKQKLMEANRCLFSLCTLCQGGYMQPDLDSLFAAIVLPKITYGLSVYAASLPELNTMQIYYRLLL